MLFLRCDRRALFVSVERFEHQLADPILGFHISDRAQQREAAPLTIHSVAARREGGSSGRRMAQARDDIARSPWVEQGAIETHRYEGGLVGSVCAFRCTRGHIGQCSVRAGVLRRRQGRERRREPQRKQGASYGGSPERCQMTSNSRKSKLVDTRNDCSCGQTT